MRFRVVLALLASAMALAASVGGGTAVSAATCTVAPELRAFTINQGLNSYGKLARGKSAVGRFYFGLPSCAISAGLGAYVQIRSAELTVSGTSTPFTTGQLGTDGPPVTYPNVTTSGTPTLADSTADVKFAIPGSAFATGSTAGYTATFSLKVFYKSAASSAGPLSATEQNTTFTTLTGSRTALSKTVEKQTRALRVLAVPGIAAPLSATDAGTLSAAMAAVGRAFPVPDGVSNSLSGSGGIRYTINGGPLDLSAAGILGSDGKFCGSPTNWDAIKAQLAQFLQSYNNNVVNPVPADRVLGVFDPSMSHGPTTDTGSTCYEGQASLISNEAYARLVPGVAGGIIGQELFHTFGGVATSFSDGGNHAIHPDFADWSTGDADRAYNVTDVTFLPRVPAASPTNRPMMKFQTSSWGSNNTLLEPGDYGQGYFLCKLGGSTTSACKTPGTTGTLTAVPAAAQTSFVMSGTTDRPGTATGTKVLESFQADTLPTPAEERPTDSPYRLIQKNGTTTLKDEGVQVSFGSTGHPASGNTENDSPSGVFSIAYQLASGVTSVEFVYRPTGVTLYQAVANGAPSISTPPPITLAASRAAESSAPTVTRHADSPAVLAREIVFAPSRLGRTEPGIRRTVFAAAAASADLAITKSDSADPVGLGNEVTYKLTVTNGGPDAASSIVVTDPLPAGVTFVSASAGCTEAAETVTCNLADLASGGTASFDIVVKTVQVGTLTNQASVTSATPDDITGNNSATETTTVEPAGGGGGGGGNATNLRTFKANRDGTACAENLRTGDASGGIGVGVAFDGAHLLLSCYNDNTITVVDPADGSQLSNYTVSGATALGALAWDKSHNVLWACSGFNKVGQIDPDTHAFVEKFTVPGCFDGLAYDIADDTIWTSPDATNSITHSKADGTFLSTNSDFSLGSGGNSGIAVGGPKLYLANNGGQEIYTSPKDFSTAPALYATFPARLEDLECDDLTFKAQNKAAIWSVDAYDNTLNAWQIAGGTCAFGGGFSPNEQPVTFTASDDGNVCNLRADIILSHNQAGVPNDVLAVAVPPDPATCASGTASFDYVAKSGCEGCEIKALVTDGLKTDVEKIADSSLKTFPQDPVAWINNPTANEKYYPSDTIVLQGGGWDYQGKAIAEEKLEWTSTPALFTGTQTGSKVVLKPPNGMWPSGSYQITLKVTDADGGTDEETISITVRVDNDNDRMDAAFESGAGCGLSDNNPFDFGLDADGDGKKNTDERFTALGPCTKETSYQANDAVWSPDPWDASKDGGTITVSNISVPGEPAQVPTAGISISEINGQAVTGDCKPIVASGSTIAKDVYAVKFNGQGFSNCVRARNLRNQRVLVRITGNGGTFHWDAFVSPFVN
jgi:uncharacterized repeat protein (TIGR01451 family)